MLQVMDHSRRDNVSPVEDTYFSRDMKEGLRVHYIAADIIY